MVPRPPVGADRRRKNRIYVYFSDSELEAIKDLADQADYPVSVLVRNIALARRIKPKRSRQDQSAIVALNKVANELNRIGNNLNQLARAANAVLASGKGELPAEAAMEEAAQTVRDISAEALEAIRRV